MAAVASLAAAADVNVALATNGTIIRVDSEWMASPFDTGGAAPGARLIDGIIAKATDEPGANRWHSDLDAPHPHWVWLRFARRARIHRVVMWRAGVGSPVDFFGQTSTDHYRSWHTLFSRKDVVLNIYHPAVAIDFKPVLTDNFRLVITRSSNEEYRNYTQASELQVFGEWVEEPPAPHVETKTRRVRGKLIDARLPRSLEVETTADTVTYRSPWLKVAFRLDKPAMSFLCIDATGQSTFRKNLLKAPTNAVAEGWEEGSNSANASFTVSRTGNRVRYRSIQLGDFETVDLTFVVWPKGLSVVVDREVRRTYLPLDASPLRMLFDAAVTPPSPMGRLKQLGELEFPVFLHFPDYGSILVRATGDDARWKFVGRRWVREVQLSLLVGQEEAADATIRLEKGHYRVTLDLKMVDASPEELRVNADHRSVSVPRSWLNIFQFRPDVACLANNSISDNVLFCLYEYADQAIWTPPLFDDFTALDLVRTSLDSYFDGSHGFGDDRDRFVDTDPAIVIASWDYAVGRGDRRWLGRRIRDIERYADHIIAADRDGDGLAESTCLGNSGIGINGAGGCSSNWWDVISFGWKDAYGNALDYRAFRCMADLESRLGYAEKAAMYRERADRVCSAFYSTFWDPKTGVLAGWRSQDGQLHDYYFTFINGIAIAYGLVTAEQGNSIIDAMNAKMRQVGYTNFRLGLPGNLIPIARKDYTGGGVTGQPSRDDGSDSFQTYENGGATASFAYFYIQGLYVLGRTDEADTILGAMLGAYGEGAYQGGVGSGVDWRRWDGTPCGYEGFLADTYYALTVYITGKLGQGVPLP